MSFVLRITVRFLDPSPSFHGRADNEGPEWPPSPLRLFQAIVDASASRWRNALFQEYAVKALGWLEELTTPVIVAPTHLVGSPFRIAVPNNDLDSPASAWVKGREPEKPHRPIDLKTMKQVRPVHVRIDDYQRDALHFLYPLPKGECPHEEVLKAATRSITHLGWGIDMVAADADVIGEAEAAILPGHRWRVVESGGVPLRVPKEGTLADLMRKHKDFLGRLSDEGYKPVPPLVCFDVKRYHSATVGVRKPPIRPLITFEIHRTLEDQEKPEYAGKSKFRPYHPARRVATVAGMVRHATAAVARRIGWSEEDVMRRVEGHGDDKDGQATSDDRLQFLPLPSITPVGVAGIRRVLVVGPPGCDLAPLRRQLNSQELVDRDTEQPVAMLSGLANTDKFLVQNYLGESETWSTVTPVILPGHDDPDGLRRKYRERVASGFASAEEQKHILQRLDSRILALIWKAFHQAGWTADALEGAMVEYRAVGWFRGLELAKNYENLPPLKYPRYHLRVRFPRKVRGPLAVGAGRYRGFGLFAIDD